MIGYIIGSILIVIVVLLLSIFTISKGYAYKHTVDPIKPASNEEWKVEQQGKDR